MGPRSQNGPTGVCSRRARMHCCIRACTTLGTRSIPGLSALVSAFNVLAASKPGQVARAHPPTSPSRLRLAVVQARETSSAVGSLARSL